MTVASLTASLIPRRRAQLARYSTWQFRDFAINIAILTAILFVLIGGVEIMLIHSQEVGMAMRRNRAGLPLTFPIEAKLAQFANIYGMFSIVAPIIATSGIIAQDRTLGYTRFLFAKPLAVRTYYAQSLLVRLIGFLVLGQILVLAYGHFEPPAYTPRFIVEMALSFVAVGGVVFLLSAVTRYDGALAIVFFLLGTVIRAHYDGTDGIGHFLSYVFPPIDQSEQLRRWVLRIDALGALSDPAFPWKLVLWNSGYGLACLVLGLYLLRRIPLTKA